MCRCPEVLDFIGNYTDYSLINNEEIMIIGRLRTQEGLLIAELSEAVALQLHNQLLNGENAKAIQLKVPGFGAKVTQNMNWDISPGVSLSLWAGTTLAIITRE